MSWVKFTVLLFIEHATGGKRLARLGTSHNSAISSHRALDCALLLIIERLCQAFSIPDKAGQYSATGHRQHISDIFHVGVSMAS